MNKKVTISGFDDLSNQLQREAQETYKIITRQLAKAVQTFEKAIQTDDIETLKKIRSQILKLILKIRKDMNNPHNPDIVTVLSEFEIIKNGESHIANEGLEARMKNHYKATIETLNDMVALLDDKIVNYDTNKKPPITLKTIFKNDHYFNVCIELFEELDITNGGITILPKGRIGKLTGAIDAMKMLGMFDIDMPTQKLLLSYFNEYLKTEYKDYSKRNADYKPSLDNALRFLKRTIKK